MKDFFLNIKALFLPYTLFVNKFNIESGHMYFNFQIENYDKTFRFRNKFYYLFLCFWAKYFKYRRFKQSYIGFDFARGHKRRYKTFCPYSKKLGQFFIDKYAFGSFKNPEPEEFLAYKHIS